MKRILSIILFAAGVFGVGQAKEQLSPDQTLWFTSPAENWAQQALHIGNGYMGASFYGSVNRERFDIAEKTFWTGGPHSLSDFKSPIIKGGKDKIDEIRKLIVEKKYVEADSLCRKYMVGNYSHYGYFSMVGNLYIDFPESEHPVKDYVRGIDLSTSRGFVEYVQEDTYFKREYFCSYPDKLMVLHFTSDKKNKINFNLSQILTYPASQVKKETDGLVFNGVIKGNGLKYCIRIKVLQEGGTVSIVNQNICIEGADQATVLYAVDTEYKQEYPLYKGENPQNNTAKIIKNAGIKGYEKIKNDHIADYQALYNRVKLILKGDELSEKLPTDTRVRQLQNGFTDDSSLKTLWFNLSRYLIISASRPGTLPSTLQGVWNTFEKAPWNGNFQSNINLQEMYWSCGPTRLTECENAYISWVKDLVESGRKTAEKYYGTRGWVSHSTGNIWGHTVPGDDILWGLYPSGAAWHCRHLWEHYVFTQDIDYLKNEAYPIMKEAALFWLENLTPYEGYLIAAPTVSAEHGIEMRNGSPVEFSTVNGEECAKKIFTVPAYQDIVMIYDLFSNVVDAANALHVDKEFSKNITIAKDKLYPLKKGKYGQLQEWVADVDNPRDHHRHIAHLYGMYPGNMISYTYTPEWANAVKKSLEMRGFGEFGDRWPHTGGNWSAAWRIALWARLHEGNTAMYIFNRLIKENGYENMMSNQSGNMQVDATMATAGLFAEMLLQSHDGFIDLLPALPTEWPEGKITGLAARGGYIIDIEWKNGSLVKAEIKMSKGSIFPVVKVNGTSISDDDSRIIVKQL